MARPSIPCYESRQIASGIQAAVKTTLTSKFRVTNEINEVDTTETRITCQMSWKGA